MKNKIAQDDFWKELYYIKLRPESKIPAESWGGYNQDFESSDTVYRWPDLKSNWRYGYVAHRQYDLGVIDIDTYKDDAPDVSELTVFDPNGESDVLIIQTPSGGFHIPFLTIMDSDYRVRSVVDGIDVKGEIARGHAVLPRHNSKYEILSEGSVVIFGQEEANQIVKYKGDPVIKFTRTSGHSDYSGDPWGLSLYPYLDRFGEYEPGVRDVHPLHGSSTGMNFMVDDNKETFRCWRHNATGNILHLLGIELDYWGCGGWLSLDYETKKPWMNELFNIAEREGYIGEEASNKPWTSIR